MDAMCSFNTSINLYQAIGVTVKDDNILEIRDSKNLKSTLRYEEFSLFGYNAV
jgi:hypothetical protein